MHQCYMLFDLPWSNKSHKSLINQFLVKKKKNNLLLNLPH